MYMLTTKMASPTYRDHSVLKEHILGPFTDLTLSTMINQKTDLNTSLDNDYCSINITIALIHMPKFKLLEIENVLQLSSVL
jgi:hypothetical protein